MPFAVASYRLEWDKSQIFVKLIERIRCVRLQKSEGVGDGAALRVGCRARGRVRCEVVAAHVLRPCASCGAPIAAASIATCACATPDSNAEVRMSRLCRARAARPTADSMPPTSVGLSTSATQCLSLIHI
eukprot:5099617-Pleurochrysis_carterae.AAC.3